MMGRLSRKLDRGGIHGRASPASARSPYLLGLCRVILLYTLAVDVGLLSTVRPD